MGIVRVAAVQMDPKIGHLERNRYTIVDRAAQAFQAGASLVAFPECALTGYCFGSREEAKPYALELPSKFLEPVIDVCRRGGGRIVVGLLEAAGDKLYNAAVLLGPEGIIASYRKVHLPYLGVDRFVDRGDQAFAVHDLGDLRVGLLICYDGSFPEPARVLSLLGADLIVMPTNWPGAADCAAEHVMPTRAMENVVYTMAIDRVGEERGYGFIGKSSIHGPSGERLAMASAVDEEILIAEIDPAKARAKRLIRIPGEHEIDRVGDRRPDFYGPITEPVRS